MAFEGHYYIMILILHFISLEIVYFSINEEMSLFIGRDLKFLIIEGTYVVLVLLKQFPAK